jgi:hypothetical protein
MCCGIGASLFVWLKPFLGLTSLRASPFYVLRTFQWLRRFSLRCFNACGV